MPTPPTADPLIEAATRREFLAAPVTTLGYVPYAVSSDTADLIIGLPFREDALSALETLAPTVLVDIGSLDDPIGAERLLAGLFGLADVFDARLAEYRARVDAVRQRSPACSKTWSTP